MKTTKMKTQLLKGFAVFTFIALQACGGAKNGVESRVNNSMVRESTPCEGAVLEAPPGVYRAVGIAVSTGEAKGRLRAEENSRILIAGRMSEMVKKVSSSYYKETQIGQDGNQFGQNDESKSNSIVKKLVQGTRPVCVEKYKTSDGRYKWYVALELDSKMLQGLIKKNSISKSAKAGLEFDEYKFDKIFKKEMDNLKEEYKSEQK